MNSRRSIVLSTKRIATRSGRYQPEGDGLGDDEIEPMAGVGPLTGALGAFAEFFDIDPDLVKAAADHPVTAMATSLDAAGEIVAALTDREKTDLLSRLFGGDPHVAVELRALVRTRLGVYYAGLSKGTRTAGELRSRARAVRLARDRVDAEKPATDRRRRAEEAEKARLVRIDALARRGEGAWQEVEAEIERRNAAGYDKAAYLLLDLRAIAETRGTLAEFGRRLYEIRERHARKERFIERLDCGLICTMMAWASGFEYLADNTGREPEKRAFTIRCSSIGIAI